MRTLSHAFLLGHTYFILGECLDLSAGVGTSTDSTKSWIGRGCSSMLAIGQAMRERIIDQIVWDAQCLGCELGYCEASELLSEAFQRLRAS